MSADLDALARIMDRRQALTEQAEAMIVDLMSQPDRNVTKIAEAARMTRAGVHKLAQRKGRA